MVKERQRIPKRHRVSIGQRETDVSHWSKRDKGFQLVTERQKGPNWSNKDRGFQLVKGRQRVSICQRATEGSNWLRDTVVYNWLKRDGEY